MQTTKRVGKTIQAASKVNAAKDAGDAKGDKARKVALATLVKKASALSDQLPDADFPEVEDALKTVQGLMDAVVKMEEISARLKTAPTGSSEAAMAQKGLDKMRSNLDAMLPSLTATVTVLEQLCLASMEMDEQMKGLQEQLKEFEDALKKEKARLAAAALAVKNATQIG
jgi:hypothetical protein